MSDCIFGSNQNCRHIDSKQDDLSELALIQQSKVADLLFLIGTFISMHANLEAEQEIINPKKNKASDQNTSAPAVNRTELITIFLILFLIGTAISANTLSERIKKEKAELSKDTSQSRINHLEGSELVLFGTLIRIVGYIISIVGNIIRTNNPIE